MCAQALGVHGPTHRQQQCIPGFIINFDVQPNVIMYG